MRASLEEGAREYQQRWGCPAAGHSPPRALEPDLASEAEHVARVTRTPLASTCPLACIERADPWVREVTEAVAIAASDWGVTVAEALGRELTHADLIALAALTRGQRESLASDRDIDRQERDAESKARAARA